MHANCFTEISETNFNCILDNSIRSVLLEVRYKGNDLMFL
jgi:hypothetical protein